MAEAGILSHGDRIELILGEILYMSPIGSKHQAIVDKLSRIFNRTLLDHAIIRVQGPIQIKDWSEPEPDVLLLKPQTDFYADQHPEAKDVFLLVEVADTSLEYDKEIKLPLYAKAGIAEYWIVNLKANHIEVHTGPDVDIYKNIKIAKGEDLISPISFPDSSISVKDILV